MALNLYKAIPAKRITLNMNPVALQVSNIFQQFHGNETK